MIVQLTEEEMKKKWCPMSKVLFIGEKGSIVPSAVGYNRASTPKNRQIPPQEAVTVNSSNCLGSGCAVWRWYAPRDGQDTPTHGYCGMGSLPI